LYSTHWYIALVYTSLKKIDIINSMETSSQDLKILTVLLDILLSALSTKSDEYTYNQSEWTICTQSTSTIPQQQNSYDCGPFALKAIEYIVAGRSLDYSQSDMSTFRYKILLAVKLKEIPWLQKPAEFSNSSDSDIISKVQASVSRNRSRSSVTTTTDPDPKKKEYIELLESTSSEGLIDDAAAIESKRRAVDEIIDIFDYYPRSVAATSSPEALIKAKSQKIRK
jgi:Ulp1 family protease